MPSTNPTYTDISSIKNYWLNTIAPNYFDFDNVNNYQVGIFGYINEVMANSVEDAFNSANIARKEFYPVTAQYMTSFYKMAAMQNLDVPLTTPAQCKAALVIPQLEILENSTVSNNVYSCTIDSCLKIFAGNNLQFMLDYPINILSSRSENGSWVHTIHYDLTVKNSLSSASASTYISNKVLNSGGVNYVILFLDAIRQLECTEVSTTLQKDASLNTVSYEIDFEGNLANFEVFYRASQNSKKVQLTKVLTNAAYPGEPFVCYELINSNKIRFTFPNNNVFTPAYNSEVTTYIYTSDGEDGNFDAYLGDLVCSSNSEDYPYNSKMTILGKVNGSSRGGRNKPSDEEFRNEVIKSYSTNNTYTIANDLQLYFDSISDSISNVKLMFRKKRDDAFIRLFGAYTLIKDQDNNVVPSNTSTLSFNKSELVNLTDSVNRIMIKPGTIFEYRNLNDKNDHTLVINPDLDITSITDNGSLYFTNPFLIGVNISPNIVGYYLNSIDTVKAIQYTYVNDKIATQFISSGVTIERNAITGINYYELTVTLMPASSSIETESLVKVNDPADDGNMIVAFADGIVIDKQYVWDEEYGYGYVDEVIQFGEDEILHIQSSTAIKPDGTKVTGYNTNYNVGESFIEGDILATRKIDDLNNLTVVGDLNGILMENNLYIPFVMDSFDEEMSAFTFKAYLSTDDSINLNSQISITHGIFNMDGTENDYLAVDMDEFQIELSALYNNEGNNQSHKYSTYENLRKFTLTNSYITDPEDLVNFVESYTYIRSVVDFSPGESPEDYVINITEMPVLQAWWANRATNYSFFIDKINLINEGLQVAYSNLENNFNIDLKFYNTFGKAKFYKVGNSSTGSELLDSLRCKFKFGVSLLTLGSEDEFLSKFRLAIKDFIEDTNSVTTSGQNTYILNLIAYLKNQFSELVYLEYYGFNSYDNKAQKIIGPNLDEYTENYIPEFVNIGIAYTEDGVAYPDIEIHIVD